MIQFEITNDTRSEGGHLVLASSGPELLVLEFLVENLPRSYCYELVVSSKTSKLVELVTFSKSWANILTTIQSVFGYFDLKLTKKRPKMTKMIKKEIYGFIMSLRENLNMEESVRALLNPIPCVFLSL